MLNNELTYQQAFSGEFYGTITNYQPTMRSPMKFTTLSWLMVRTGCVFNHEPLQP